MHLRMYFSRCCRHPSVSGDDGVASIIWIYLHFLAWMCRPTCEWQSLPHLVQEKGVGCWRCLLRSFRLFLFSKAAVVNASSVNFAPCLTVCLQDGRSSSMLSHEWLSMPHRFMSLWQTSLKHSLGRPAWCEPSASSPYKRSLGMRLGSILLTWPNQRSLLLQRMVYIDLMLAGRSTTSVLLILSCHVMCRIRLSHRLWLTAVELILMPHVSGLKIHYRRGLINVYPGFLSEAGVVPNSLV